MQLNARDTPPPIHGLRKWLTFVTLHNKVTFAGKTLNASHKEQKECV